MKLLDALGSGNPAESVSVLPATLAGTPAIETLPARAEHSVDILRLQDLVRIVQGLVLCPVGRSTEVACFTQTLAPSGRVALHAITIIKAITRSQKSCYEHR